jgi:hypothetical protein
MKRIIPLTILLIALFLLISLTHAEKDQQVLSAKSETRPVGVAAPPPTVNQQAATKAYPDIGYKMVTDVLDAFGRASSSTNYRIPVNSGGQIVSGTSQSTNYRMKAGFVHSTSVYRGDANADAVIDVGDVVYLINYLFKSGPVPHPLEAGDVNCDGNVDVGDVVYLINYLFKNGPPPSC